MIGCEQWYGAEVGYRKMALISVEDIGQCRSGPSNDIDLQAVFGGRLSGKREKDLKVNPVYSDANHVNQFSDINGNMSPVHVVTYESFPRTRKKTSSLENGKIQNGDIIQSSRVIWAENNNNIGEIALVENHKRNIDNNENNSRHVSETERKDEKLNEENLRIGKSVHLQSTHSKTASSEIQNSQTDYKANTDENHEDHVHTISDKILQPKAYQKNYGLLGYDNESFVLDESQAVNEAKQVDNSDPEDTLNKEIHYSSAGHNNCTESRADSLNSSDKNHEIPKIVSKEIVSEVKESRNHSQSEIFVTSDLPESTYQEISDLYDSHKSVTNEISSSHYLTVETDDELSIRCESPQICHKEIVTEVLVHNSAGPETPKMHSHIKYSQSDNICHSFDMEKYPLEMLSQSESSDWPDIDELVRNTEDETFEPSISEIAQTEDIETEGRARSVSDIIIQDKGLDGSTDNKVTNCSADTLESSSLYRKQQNKSNSSSKTYLVSEAGSSTRTLKSILSNGSSYYSCTSETEHRRQNSDLEIHELKTVKFSEDTVFNENKSNRYKKEKFGHINLRELYRGKIMSDTAVAKMNPLYQPEGNAIEGEEEGDTDNEKLTYQLTLKNALRLSKGQTGSLNSPSYLEQYLILKAHGIKDTVDIEKLPETMEKPVYDRLIQRTLAKERRKFCVKWSMVIITVAVITAVATTLGVYFKEGF